jgi:hypothetical protein
MPDDIQPQPPADESQTGPAGADQNAASKISSMLNGLQNFNVANFIKGKPGQWQKMGVVAVIVVIVMGLGAIMMWGIALWALGNSFGEPNSSTNGSATSSLSYPKGIDSGQAAVCLNNYLKNKRSDSPLNGHGEAFVRSGNMNNVNPAFLAAQAGKESTFATGWGAIEPEWFNYASLTCGCTQRSPCAKKSSSSNPRTWEVYGSWDEAIEKHGRYVQRRYLSRGITSIIEIGRIYAGPSEGVDWARDVTTIFNEILTTCPALKVEVESAGASGTGQNNVPLFKQCVSPWGNNAYNKPNGDRKTVCSSGCGPASGAMVLKFYGKNVDPGIISSFSLRNGGRANTGTNHSLFPKLAREYGLQYERIGFTKAEKVLQSGQPLILSVKNLYYNGKTRFSGGHFIVLTGIEGNKIFINDSSGVNVTSISMSALKQAFRAGIHYIHP